MVRWSLSKTFFNVSRDDFVDAVRNVQETLQARSRQPFLLSVSFYSALKGSCTSFLEPEVLEMLRKFNDSKVFEATNDLSSLNQQAWDKAVYVEAIIRPSNPETAPSDSVAYIEAKGLLPKQLCFYAQGGDLGEHARMASIKEFKGWAVGDGFKSNHTVTLG